MLVRAGFVGRTTARRVVAPAPVPGWPASQDHSNITRVSGGGGTAATTFTAFSSQNIPDGSLALCFVSVGSSNAMTIDTGASGTDWTEVGTQTQSTVVRVSIFSWFNNTGSTQSRTLTFSSIAGGGSRSPRSLLLIIPRSAPGLTLVATGTMAGGGIGSPNPPSHDVGATRKTLWLATASGTSALGTMTATPSTPGTWDSGSYEALTATGTGTNPTSLFVIQQFSETQTLDPGSYTSGAATNWVTSTVGVYETV